VLGGYKLIIGYENNNTLSFEDFRATAVGRAMHNFLILPK
jgi:hypothetical protein